MNIAIVGFGNVGRAAYEAVQAAGDMTVACVVGSPRRAAPDYVKDIWVTGVENVHAHGKVDCALLCLPTRACPAAAETLLTMGVNTVDSYDIHESIWDVRCQLDSVAKQHGASAIVAAGWDPGSDSVVRALMQAIVPRGITYTNFGPGMSMGHSVAAKAIAGVANALSITLPTGAGVHRRMVYVELQPGATLEQVTRDLKADAYFAKDDTHVMQVDDIAALQDVGHGVQMTRKGASGAAHNQQLEFSMRINNPALTSQIMAACARACAKQAPGAYTMIEVPVANLLPGTLEGNVRGLV
ncbi:MAG: diaminopimelate dehydrogenase [Oscillospiraceae bacterium]|nr:diaminopimelate dehydrogenase [Oscillospiraceae bacterium]